MTKSEALKLSDGSVKKLGRMLGITHNAISQWSDEKIPKLREYQLKEISEKQAHSQQQPETT